MAQEINKKDGEVFFNKKNLILVIVFILISILLFCINFLFVLKTDWKEFRSCMNYGFKNGGNDAIGLFIGLFLFFVVSFFVNYWPRKLRMDKMGVKLTFFEEIIFSMSVFFMFLISPSVILMDAYILFFLKSKKINNVNASAIVISQEMISQFSMLCFSLPSFLYMTTQYNIIHSAGSQATLCYWLMLIGLGSDIFFLLITFLLSKSTRVQYIIAVSFNKIKKTFKVKYNTKQQIKEDIINKGIVRREVNKLICQWNDTIAIFLMVLVYCFARYVVMYFAFDFLRYSYSESTQPKFWPFFNLASVSTMATKFVPIPGSMVSIEWVMTQFADINKLNYFKNDWKSPTDFIHNGILLYRSSVLYVPSILGLPFFISFFIIDLIKAKKHKI